MAEPVPPFDTLLEIIQLVTIALLALPRDTPSQKHPVITKLLIALAVKE
jgi:hypothetical protein